MTITTQYSPMYHLRQAADNKLRQGHEEHFFQLLSGAAPHRRLQVTDFYLIHLQDRASSLLRQDDNILPIFKRSVEDLGISWQRSLDKP
jgi:cellobiose-specific phosphotransferase system component IIA